MASNARSALLGVFMVADAKTLCSVFEDVGELCARICPDDLAAFKPEPQEDYATASAGEDGGDEEEEEEEDDDEEEEEEEEEEDDHSNRNLRSDSEDSD